jgi:hypothetical protein
MSGPSAGHQAASDRLEATAARLRRERACTWPANAGIHESVTADSRVRECRALARLDIPVNFIMRI